MQNGLKFLKISVMMKAEDQNTAELGRCLNIEDQVRLGEYKL